MQKRSNRKNKNFPFLRLVKIESNNKDFVRITKNKDYSGDITDYSIHYTVEEESDCLPSTVHLQLISKSIKRDPEHSDIRLDPTFTPHLILTPQ